MIKQRKKLSVRKMAIVGVLGGLSIALGLTPLGFIPVGPTRATIMHIPVIIGGILEGPLVGGLIGLIFGLSSIFQAATNPTPVSFVFLNPLVSVLPRVLIGIVAHYVYKGAKNLGENKTLGLFRLLWIGIIFYLSYGIYNGIKLDNGIGAIITNIILIALTLIFGIYGQKKLKGNANSVVIAAILGTLTNTVGVLSMIYFIHGEKFVKGLGQNPDMARKIIFGIGITNGIPEIIIGTIIVTNVVAALNNRVK
ncbi:MAG: ECF transporter S component [Tissierellia bacterium]|nr:ECF transporter S component [Tissierellia bacterium]